MSNTSSNKTSKTNKQTVKVIVGEIGRDTKTGILGRGYSYDNGATFHVTDTMFGRLYDKDDGERMWPNMAHKVADEIKSATADLPNVRKQANEAVKFAESAIAASKVNSDAIVAQSSAVVEAKSAMDSATAEIQQLKANAASDVAQIRADVAQVQNEVDTAKAANSASVDKLKSDIGLAQKDLDNVRDSLTKAQSAVEQNQKLINDSVAKITSDVSATKQDLADVHDSLAKAQAAAEANQKAIDQSIAQINSDVDGTKQDLAGVRKDLTKAQADITANQKSINDNVAQINADITQDRKDIASAQQANADTAKQLDAYSKQAAAQGKTIKSIQDKQDGFTATLADVQGNVAQVSDKVDGLSANLKDTQGNVASVKAQADQLSATLTDHGKAIATLTASAKELSSTLEDADGRLSKVEQTAKTNSSTLSDVQGDLSQVKQDATALTSTLKDTQGNISTLQQKADSVSAQLASAQGDIATLQTGVDGVKATLASHDKTIHTLQLDSKSLKDSMADAQGDISTLQKSATSLDSEMKDHAGRLSKVEQSAATQATTLSDVQGNLTQVKQQADGLVTTLKNAQGDITQIQQKADGTLEQLKSAQGDIASLQTDVTGIKATLVSHEGDIHTLQLDSKTLKDNMADAKGNISSLQKTADSVESSLEDASGRLSKVEQTAKEHTSTISDLGDKLNNMKIGGRNLLVGTAKFNFPLNSNGGTQTIQKYDDETNYIQHTSNTPLNGMGPWWPFTPEVGQVYTLSADVCGNGYIQGGEFHYEGADNGSLGQVNLTNNWQRISNTFRVNTIAGNWAIYANNSTLLRVKHIKIELGNVATDWTPAPEDMATVTQVKQTADGITTTLKNAQGDIDQIRQQANGTSEQLSNVQGDVTNIQKDVNGLKQTTADNAGNIHTLQSDSKTLKDDIQDAQGDISILKKTSTDVTSELKDHDGRISKTEQTASTLTNEFVDQQGHLNRVEQTAQGTQQTVANQQGQINNIKTDAAGMHQTITGQGNQLANINVTLSGLNSKYEGVSGDLGKLKDQTDWKIVTGAFDANQYTKTARIFYQDLQGKNTPNVGWFYLIVDAPSTIRITQTLIKDNSTDTWTRVKVNDQWQAWTKGATNLDVTALSNRITTNSTQITQNKKEIDLKADQSTVDNLTGEVSQAQAQLKVQAGQISSKVSSTDFKTLNDKVNGMQIGGRNLLRGTAKFNFPTISNGGTQSVQKYDDETNYLQYTSSQPILIGPWFGTFTPEVGKTYTFSADVSGNGYIEGDFLKYEGKDSQTLSRVDLTDNWQRISNTIHIGRISGNWIIYAGDSTLLKIKHIKIEEGNVATDWTPAPEDTITAIQKNTTAIDQTNQKISLKADQTEVDQIKNTASQNSSRLNVMANEISSKVTSTDVNNIVDGKGYATTSTVQSLITQKAGTINESITNLDAKYSAKDGVNLQTGTSDCSFPFTANQGQAVVEKYDDHTKMIHAYGSASGFYIGFGNGTFIPDIGEKYTISADIKGKGTIDRNGFKYEGSDSISTNEVTLSNNWQRISCTVHVSQHAGTWIFYPNPGNGNNDFYVKHIKIERGSVATPWTPAPIDNATVTQVQEITASIDGLQSTVANKADKSQITQLSNMIQSKVSSADFNSRITQLSNDINLRVTKGNVLSQINLTAGNTLIQSNKLYLDASSVAFSGRAFIPSAAIAEIDADKLTFYGNGTKATIGAGIAEYDQDKVKSTISMQYSGGFEIHSSNELGSILTMHDNTVRLASKSQTYSAGSGKPLDQQYSGFWAGSNYALINAVDGEGKTTGWSIGPSNSNGYRAYLYDSSTSVQPNYGVGIGTQRFDVYAGGADLYLGPDKAELRGKSYTKIHSDTETFIEGGNQQMYMHNGEVNIGNPNDTGNATGVHFQVFGWASFNGYVEGMGWTTKSTLSSKTRIEKLDTKDALNKIMSTDLETFQYKTEVAGGMTKRHAGPIIDDVHDVAQYSTPDEFINERRTGRSDADVIGYLMGAVQELKKQLDEMKKEVQING